ncbi:protein kinase [Promicromonospora sp. NPDC023805]|uniref:protein kinase domain-containing protein n=1 Tax=Promicromonospora sp. NPDC023805 TaxID=3154696 RepID=UPI0033D5AB52
MTFLEPLDPAADPREIGPYRLLGRLGRGGMGAVYLGRSRGGREVALKVIRGELAADPHFRQRFEREVAAARRVGGFYAAEVVDADTDSDRPWMATNYIHGPSLQAAVDAHGPLPVEAVLAIGAGLAEGLQAIHSAGLVHRDLKPANIIIAADGPRVIDFGITRALDVTSFTSADALMGTPAYMPPEQALGHPVEAAGDVFAFGGVLTFAVSGHNPFGSGRLETMVYRVVHGEPDMTGVPDELRSMVLACLAKDSAARPQVPQVLDWLADSGDAATVMVGAASNRPWLTDGIATMIAERNGTRTTGSLPLARPAQSTTGQVPAAAPEPVPARPVAPLPSEQAVSSPASDIPIAVPETHFRGAADATEMSRPDAQAPAPVTEPGWSRRRWIWSAVALAGVLVLAVGGFFLMRLLLPGGDGPLVTASGGASPGVTDTDANADTEADPSDTPDSAPANEGQFTAADCPAPVQEPRATYSLPEDESASENRKWHATLKTCVGDIEVELDGVSAPAAVAVFVELARGGYYDGTGCHELKTADPYRLKCGDPSFSGEGNPGFVFGPPENVPADAVYPAGSLVMGFNGEGYSDAQFSLVYADSNLPSPQGQTVFGKVTSGMEILEAVAEQGSKGNGQPEQPVTITSIELQ